MRATLVIGALVLASFAATPRFAGAHHGASTFDTSTDMTLKGTVTEWLWFNPHCFLKFDVKDDTGKVTNWAVETSNPIDMTKRGWARSTFRRGDEVTVKLQPARNGTPVGRILTVTVNGKVFQ